MLTYVTSENADSIYRYLLVASNESDFSFWLYSQKIDHQISIIEELLLLPKVAYCHVNGHRHHALAVKRCVDVNALQQWLIDYINPLAQQRIQRFLRRYSLT